jgi:hypothetical protein
MDSRAAEESTFSEPGYHYVLIKDRFSMDKRQHKRISYCLNTEIICDGISYKGLIENISETGIFKIAFPDQNFLSFYPGKEITVIFQIPSGTTLNLNCEIKWLRINTGSPFAIKYNLGLNIIDPPREYIEFVKSLKKQIDNPLFITEANSC